MGHLEPNCGEEKPDWKYVEAMREIILINQLPN